MFANAEAYERFMGRWSRKMAARLVQFAGLQDGWKVLDVGSGTGSLAREIAARLPGCSIVGVEPSPGFVEYARAQVGSANAQFEVGDAQELRFAEGAFDACLALLVLNFVPNVKKALAELRRVTRPGGRIAAVVWDYSKGMEMLRICFDAARKLDPAAERADEKNMPLSREGELGVLWREASLREVEEQPLEIALGFAGFDDFWEPLLLGQGPAGAYVKGLSSEARAALRAEIAARLPKEAQSGPFELRAVGWGVRGVK